MSQDRSPELLYHHVESDLRQQIISGTYKPGKQLPTESELCEIYGVSRITVRRAIQELVDDGLLNRFRGKGTFVRFPSHEFSGSKEMNPGFAGIGSTGEESFRHVLKKERIPASDLLSQKLGIPLGNEVQYIVRITYIDDLPISIDHTYVSSEVIPHFLEGMQENMGLYEYLNANYTVELDTADLSISTTTATKEQSERFNCMTGAPVLVFDKTVSDARGRIVHYSRTYLNGEYTYAHLIFTKDGILKNPTSN